MSAKSPAPRPDLEALLAAAKEARLRAYAPYSNYHVGAAVLGDNGRIYQGANVENASYGLSVCAERAAVIAAVLDGCRRLYGAAVVTGSSPPAAPCGTCRQTLAEFAQDLPVALQSETGERIDTSLAILLPHAFRPEDLK
jgi:cytidine deaminase